MINYSQDSGDWFNNVLISAIEKRASDIHFEPERDTFNVRFRVDGLLHESESLNKYSQDNIISKIKVLSNMNITEHRLPQDGHFEFNYKNRIYNIRASTLSGLYGETLVLRILNREEILINLENLGFLSDQLELVNKIIVGSSGLVIVTGPTGSGKTNLLYSIIRTLNKPDKNIITLEDPIEYQMPNIRQTQINESVGLSYSKAMRSVLRQDPDIVMLGEIRDIDTAQMAVMASLAGIFIFTSFHTFDVAALVTRFQELGISNAIIAQAVRGVISTRLIRIICSFCKEPQKPDYEKIGPSARRIIDRFSAQATFQRGRGCDKCDGKGYLGRTGIFEVVYFDEEIQASIIERRSAFFIRELIKKKKNKSIRECAIEKAIRGITTFEEVVRVLGMEMEENFDKNTPTP
ncbi:MAG: type II/IV secretion system protein [Candidatus Levybacteria bacterium]|nr:type II/IV secretion system protein [Candidatus Levybacteria bacterium]